LVALTDRVLLAGQGAVWERRGSDDRWQRLESREVEILPTGDRRYSHLLVAADGARLYDEAAQTYRGLELPAPATQLTSALIHGGKLVLGSAAAGVWVAPVPVTPPEPGAGGSIEAGGLAGAPQR
jgi:hypothetical protein